MIKLQQNSSSNRKWQSFCSHQSSSSSSSRWQSSRQSCQSSRQSHQSSRPSSRQNYQSKRQSCSTSSSWRWSSAAAVKAAATAAGAAKAAQPVPKQHSTQNSRTVHTHLLPFYLTLYFCRKRRNYRNNRRCLLLGLLWGKVWKETEDLGLLGWNEAKVGTSLVKQICIKVNWGRMWGFRVVVGFFTLN